MNPARKLIVLGFGAALIGLFLPAPFKYPLTVLGLSFCAFCAYFFRDPDVLCPQAPDKIYSPAHGTVLSIRKEGPAPVITVRIFLSVFDVHVQRAPTNGKVLKTHHQPGTFKMAMKPEAVFNERNSISIQTQRGLMIVEQITGAIARRIQCWVKEGQEILAGERIGMIYFGSQVALHLPEGTEVSVKVGDKVVGGLTEIARWPS